MKETQTIETQKKTIKTTVRITGSEAVVKCLLAEGVEVLYGYPGGAIMPVYDELFKYQIQRCHSVRVNSFVKVYGHDSTRAFFRFNEHH